MFFIVERQENLQLHPKYFGKNLQGHILAALKKKVEGTLSGRWGYTILVVSLSKYGKGHLHETTGFAHFPVTFAALVFRPFLNETLCAIVSSVSNNGFFCTAGPCQIFVSRWQMPEDLKFDDQGAPMWRASEYEIREGYSVHVKLVAVRLQADGMSILGSIKSNYLGPLEDMGY